MMKQSAIRSLGLGVGMLTLIQLPALASNSMLTAAPFGASRSLSGQVSGQVADEPTLIAVALSSRTLQQGDFGSDVRLLQRFLSRIGLYTFQVDGEYGIDTANAVATYQRIRDLPATGIADEETLVAMDFDFLPETSTPVQAQPAVVNRGTSSLLGGNLVPGSSGSDVIALQQRLVSFGIPIFVDGVYGFETEQAVSTYQRVQGLSVTGSADNATLKSMGFSVPDYRYVAAVIADQAVLTDVQRYFPQAFVDRNRRGRFINIGSFAERFPAEARVDAAAARGFTTRVLYR